MMQGRIVIVNGTSSAGKSALIAEFVERRARTGDCWIATGIDDFNAMLPWQWLDVVQVQGPYGDDGLRFVGDDVMRTVEVGDVGRRLFSAYRRSVAVVARQGLNVIVDEVAFDQAAVADWHRALDGLSASWVALRCDPDVAAERERARGDRAIGLARGLSAVVHESVTYDFELDSTTRPPRALAIDLDHYVAPPS